MAKRNSWGISWVGDEQVLIHESETSVSTGMLSYSRSSSNSLVVRMDLERYQYELARVENEKEFSEEFSPEFFYRRIDGHNYSHPVAEREAFDRRHQRARRIATRASSETVTAAVLLDADLNTPLLEHVDDDDPQVILRGTHRGIGVGPDPDAPVDTISPSSGTELYVVFSPTEITFIVGQRTRDRIETISYDGIHGGEVSTGVLKNRLTIEHPDGPFHIWVPPGHGTADLDAAVGAITAVVPTARFSSSSTTSRLQAWWDDLGEADADDGSEPEFDPSGIDTGTRWWHGVRLAVLFPIATFLVFFLTLFVMGAVYGTVPDFGENALVDGISMLFVLSFPVALILFSIAASKDKAALVEETGYGTKRHPVTIAALVYFSAGLYALYYVYHRRTTYGS